MASSRLASQGLVLLMMLQFPHRLSAVIKSEEACSNNLTGSGCKASDGSFMEHDDAHSFLQITSSEGGQASRSESLSLSPNARSTCAALVNKGSYFSIDVEVGTPGQTFSVVADTGSNSLIVPSCQCKLQLFSSCRKEDRCYTGTNKSSSFSLITTDDGQIPQFSVGFGSGTITAVPAKEVVKIGDITVPMDKGILLMTSSMLKISGSFEGILGLGLPNSTVEMEAEQKRQEAAAKKAAKNGSTSKEDLMKEIMKKIFGGYEKDAVAKVTDNATTGKEQPSTKSNILDTTPRQFPFPSSWPWKHQKKQEKKTKPIVIPPNPPGLLEQAHIDSFSMCFNDGANGYLRLGTGAAANSLGNIGKLHWGLGLSGMTLGSNKTKLNFCTNKTDDQVSSCAFIPDSGTTLMMGPKDQLAEMFDNLCDNWDRCVKNHTAMIEAADVAKKAAIKAYGMDPFLIKPYTKTQVLALLLLDCQSWLTESDGLNELPPINFHIEGADGEQQNLELPGWAYILESTSDQVNETYKHLQSLLQEDTLKNATKHEKVCSPAFGAMQYDTLNNGPVWILGTPLFYQYNVGYSLASKSLSFTSVDSTPCAPCKESASLLSHSRKQTTARSAHRHPRRVSGAMRVPNIDVLQPL